MWNDIFVIGLKIEATFRKCSENWIGRACLVKSVCEGGHFEANWIRKFHSRRRRSRRRRGEGGGGRRRRRRGGCGQKMFRDLRFAHAHNSSYPRRSQKLSFFLLRSSAVLTWPIYFDSLKISLSRVWNPSSSPSPLKYLLIGSRPLFRFRIALKCKKTCPKRTITKTSRFITRDWTISKLNDLIFSSLLFNWLKNIESWE